MPDNGTVDRVESAANITLIVSKGATTGAGSRKSAIQESNNAETSSEAGPAADFIEIPISRLDTTKEVEISEIRESSLKTNGYSITSISYSGTMMFKGSRVTKTLPDSLSDKDEKSGTFRITDFLYDEEGVPVPVSININHDLTGEREHYKHVLVKSESYEVRSEETTETAFDWIAMDRASDQPA